MQTHGGVPAEEAVSSPERKFHHRLMFDWNRDGDFDHALSDMSKYLSSATTNRNLSGSAPQSLTLVQGSAAAELTVVVGGRYSTDYSIADIFSPYQLNSPFWNTDIVGVECTFELGVETALGVVWYPQFVGNVRTITPDRGDFSVEIKALDRAELLRRPVEFPPWAMFEYHSSFENSTVSQLCDSQWVIDTCLRMSKVSPSPSRPVTTDEWNEPADSGTRPQFWLSGTGSYLPTIGFLDNYNTFQFPNDDSDFEMYSIGAAHPDSPNPELPPLGIGGTADGYGHLLYYWSDDKEKINSQAVQIMGFTMITNPDAQWADYYLTAPDQMVMRVEFGDRYYGEIWMENGTVYGVWGDDFTTTSYATPAVTIPAGQDYVKIDFVVDAFNVAGVRAYISAGTNSTGPGWDTLNTAITHAGRAWDYRGYVQVRHRQPLCDAYYTGTNYGGGTPETWVADWGARAAEYVAVLDSGFNRFSYMPLTETGDAWELISEVASAEFGSVFWDENGVFRFWNYDSIRMLQNVPVRTLTLDDITGLSFTSYLDSVTNIITVDATDRRSFLATIFESSNEWEFYLPAGEFSRFEIPIADMQTHSPEAPPRYETIVPGSVLPTWGDEIIHGYVAQFLHYDGLWYEDALLVGNLSFDQWRDYQGRLVIEVWNGWPLAARLWTNENGTGLRISGTKMGDITNKTYTYRDITSINKYGGRNMQLSGPWYQEFHNQTGGIERIIQVTKDAVPDTEAITMAGDPRVQLGDTFRVTDPEGFGSRFDMQVFGITRKYDVNEGLTDQLAVKLIRTAGGIWDDNQYGIWGSTFVWGN